MHVRVFKVANDVGVAAAQEIVERVQKSGDSGRQCVLGLAAGGSPIAVYRRLVRLHRRGMSFANVVTFNLDEYYPMQPTN